MANFSQKEDDNRQTIIVGYSWFSSVKTAETIYESGHEWIGIIKTSHSLFPKKKNLKIC
jgi:hypothetical protein